MYLFVSPVTMKLCSVRSFFCLEMPQLGSRSASFVKCSKKKNFVNSRILWKTNLIISGLVLHYHSFSVHLPTSSADIHLTIFNPFSVTLITCSIYLSTELLMPSSSLHEWLFVYIYIVSLKLLPEPISLRDSKISSLIWNYYLLFLDMAKAFHPRT